VASNESLSFNTTGVQPQMITDIGSTKHRKSPVDTKFALFGAPISLTRTSEYIFGQGKVSRGAVISPLAGDFSAGTQGLTKDAHLLDIMPFAGASTNQGFDPNDPLYLDIARSANFINIKKKADEDERFNP
jgi:hypothetical protein